jgi:hypothetical protein
MTPITIHLDTSRYVAPTEDDIRKAKQYILRRSEVANELADIATDLLTDAAVKIVEIAYKYNIPGNTFTIGASPEQQNEINAVMDDLEEKLLELLEGTILDNLKNDDGTPISIERRMALLAFMLSLGHRNQNLRSTLFNYEWRFLYDLEAAIASLKLAGVDLPNAITKIRSHIASIYTMSEVQAAIRRQNNVMAEFLRTAGVPHNPDGSPNLQGVPREGFNAIINSIRITNDIVWGHNQLQNFIEQGAVGYYQLRGSTYPCRVCDEQVGFHLGLIDADDLPHPNCMCFRIPIFEIPQ